MYYWLFKTEPDEFSIDDLAQAPNGTAPWDGIRNYQARNLLRDKVKRGDGVLIYHGSCKQVGIAGIAEVVKNAYPDPAQFNPESSYFDPKATPENPRWFCVDVAFKRRFSEVLPLNAIKQMPELSNMVLLKQGRLSVQPVTAQEWRFLIKCADADA